MRAKECMDRQICAETQNWTWIGKGMHRLKIGHRLANICRVIGHVQVHIPGQGRAAAHNSGTPVVSISRFATKKS